VNEKHLIHIRTSLLGEILLKVITLQIPAGTYKRRKNKTKPKKKHIPVEAQVLIELKESSMRDICHKKRNYVKAESKTDTFFMPTLFFGRNKCG